MRSVHTLASVHVHRGGTSLPCLACGTPGRGNCASVGFTLPPSYPPSLHGRYPLLRYCEDSDSCPPPSCTGTGILDSQTCASGHSVSNHPMRPCLPAITSCSGQAWPIDSLGSRYRRCFGLRTLPAVSSVAYGRIEFVSRALLKPVISTDYPFTSSCFPRRVATTRLLSVTDGSLHPRGTFTLLRTPALKRTGVRHPA